jgi:HAD superfamily hydrolase (TIGR01509 family)
VDGLALIFDLDGVILHSTEMHNRAWELYDRYGIARDGIQERMFGKHNDEIVRDFFGAGLSEEEVRRHGAAKEQLYREMMRPVLRRHLVSGVVGFVERHCALPKAVASNAEAANVAFVLEETGLGRYFPVVVDGSQVGRPKPSPEIYLRAAELLGTRAPRCVVFEDSPVGVAAARAAGAWVVGLRTTMRDPGEVDLVVDDFQDAGLSGWLENLRERT